MINTLQLNKEISPLADHVLSNNFPWYYQSLSTSETYPFFSHIVVKRYNTQCESMKINSDIFYHVVPIVDTFCKTKNISYSRILRMSFNTMGSFTDKLFTDPHVDYDFEHKVILIYFTSNNGDTIIFDKTYDGKNTILFNETKLPIKQKIIPEFGKVVCFDGLYYHANRFCNSGDRRVICVVCIQ